MFVTLHCTIVAPCCFASVFGLSIYLKFLYFAWESSLQSSLRCSCLGNNIIIPLSDGQPAGILSSHAAEIHHARDPQKTRSRRSKPQQDYLGACSVFPQTVFMKLYRIKSFFYSSGGHIWHGTAVIVVARYTRSACVSQRKSVSAVANSKNSSDKNKTVVTNIDTKLQPLHTLHVVNKAEECPPTVLPTPSLLLVSYLYLDHIFSSYQMLVWFRL